MMLGGDELSRTQRGNNNAYCQDSDIAWVSWELNDRAKSFLEFSRAVCRIRQTEPAYRRNRFFTGREFPGSTFRDVLWLAQTGSEMDSATWGDGNTQSLGVLFAPESGPEDSLLLLFNGSNKSFNFPPHALPQLSDW